MPLQLPAPDRQIDRGRAGCTPEGLGAHKEGFGVYVLRTSSRLRASEVFSAYKRRWGVETLYQCVKDVGGFEGLKAEDYCKERGMAFVMLACGRIRARMTDAARSLSDPTTSVGDAPLMARRMKLVLRGATWALSNTRAKDLETLARMGFVPVRQVDAV